MIFLKDYIWSDGKIISTKMEKVKKDVKAMYLDIIQNTFLSLLWSKFMYCKNVDLRMWKFSGVPICKLEF